MSLLDDLLKDAPVFYEPVKEKKPEPIVFPPIRWKWPKYKPPKPVKREPGLYLQQGFRGVTLTYVTRDLGIVAYAKTIEKAKVVLRDSIKYNETWRKAFGKDFFPVNELKGNIGKRLKGGL